MSTAQFRTEADVMRNAANNVDDTNDSVNAELNRLQDVAQSTRDYWSGSAQASFDDLMVRFDDAERRLSEALGDIASNIRDNASNFEDVDATNSDAFANIAPAGGLVL
ncbi:WXG100 family type VII secretion target [Corynebacterium appendicis CIP 107643]|uniref:ESAT-6-like protein n=1 Tax=Corynebacterium appendicis CIP 107643 TaxID=1161099 RepID=A0A1N7JAK9_9CORY|nr:WXG100 family type VII secretion target [Corynebacterium appendicis]MCT1684128.1 WXG100 family type VII secretion target [Corynebacterium appendicis]MDK8626317.1 WXG100 family type VII secretion target [Corynebacterium appendicis]WJY60306.1 WXG domain conatining protein [Corynebacterium appendicis CIP 107643]SIS46358.1 WXG100 family type VII secretion target [Corynebacterium appendicis CIP 107643]